MGMQIIGPDNADLAVLQLAYAYEQVTQFVRRFPPPLLASPDSAGRPAQPRTRSAPV